MAKQEILYVCEVCGEKYQKKENAEQCERQHYRAVRITDVTYDKHERKKEFPLTINVKLKNGNGNEKVITYSRK